jgi:serine/threonine protein kinase
MTDKHTVVPKRLKSVRELGHGSFGKVYLMIDEVTKSKYAVKVEEVKTKTPQLWYEARVYRELRRCEGVAKAYVYWTEGNYNYMAMEILGPSLEACRKKITHADVVTWLAPQSLRIIERIHKKSFLHRDIKPDNFLLGPTGVSGRQLTIIDFGLSKRYQTDGHHIAYREGKNLTGTARYASINTHRGIEQSRRDDLETLGYMLLYLFKGSLPWQGLAARNKSKTKSEQYQNIAEMKISMPLDELCCDAPGAFIHYFRYVRMLEFDEAPDYNLLCQFFQS